jgi:alkylation response protein AidB-like acyl-CoA dehydrogenase
MVDRHGYNGRLALSLRSFPMDFSFTEDQLSIQSIAREFAQKRIAPVAAEFDEKGEFPLENIREMGKLGLMGIEVPEAYGGAAMDTIAYVLAMIEIAAADAATSTIMSVNNSLICNAILKHGTEEQKQTYVRAIATGAMRFCANSRAIDWIDN